MTIVAKFLDVKHALPKAICVLQDLRGVNNYHVEQKQRHPYGLYLNSINTIAINLIDLIDEITKAKENIKFSQVDRDGLGCNLNLLKSTNTLLQSIFIHFEDCEIILDSFFLCTKDPVLKKIKKDFYKSIEIFRNHVAIIANYIKHRHAQLRPVGFYWNGDSVVGFYLEGPDNMGVLGPDIDLHKDGHSALSYNRELPYCVANIFAVGSALASALHAIDSRLLPVEKPNYPDVWSENWLIALRLVSDLPKFYFPDEVAKELPLVLVKNSTVIIEYPSRALKVYKPPPGSRLTFSARGDPIIETKHRMPYHYLWDKNKPGFVFSNELTPKLGRILIKE